MHGRGVVECPPQALVVVGRHEDVRVRLADIAAATLPGALDDALARLLERAYEAACPEHDGFARREPHRHAATAFRKTATWSLARAFQAPNVTIRPTVVATDQRRPTERGRPRSTS